VAKVTEGVMHALCECGLSERHGKYTAGFFACDCWVASAAAAQATGDVFRVYCWFPNGTYECIAENVHAEAAVMKARDYTRPDRPGVLIGAIARVTIVDSDDLTVFEWVNGRGVTFPKESAGLR
jgi:hypothetical protein